jgi:hypothetical protein
VSRTIQEIASRADKGSHATALNKVKLGCKDIKSLISWLGIQEQQG